MKRLMSPYVAMAVVLAMYTVKIVTKLVVGHTVNSPMIIGDGWHNAADIVEATLVLVMLWLGARPKNERYPFGRKNAESLVTLATGIGLLLLCAKLAAQSAFSLFMIVPALAPTLAAWDPFHREPLLVGAFGSATFWMALAVTAGSSLVSFAVSRYQIGVGRRTGHPSLVADGEETRSDGYVELAAALGIVSVAATGIAKFEDACTLLIAWKLFGTGRELFLNGWHALLQHSLGPEVEADISAATMRLAGTVKVADLKTFRVGTEAVVIIKVFTRAGLEATRMMKKALVERIAAALKTHGYDELDVYVRFDCPSPKEHRVAYAMNQPECFEERLAFTTLFRICDIVDGDVERVRDTPSGRKGGIDAMIAVLKTKRVVRLYVKGEGDEEDRRACEAAGIRYATIPGGWPSWYGCDADADDL